MRDNGNSTALTLRSEDGGRQLGPIDWIRTEFQVGRRDGFTPEVIARREAPRPTSAAAPTMRLAEPPKWAQRDDLPCTTRVPKGNQPDLYDTSDEKLAKRLCAGCPVVSECLADAMADEKGLGARSRWLVRGALTPAQRAALDPTSPHGGTTHPLG